MAEYEMNQQNRLRRTISHCNSENRQLKELMDERTVTQTMMTLRPRVTKTNGHGAPTVGYTNHSVYPHVLTKPSRGSQFLWWTNPLKETLIVTDGNRSHDLGQVTAAPTGYVWHHSELTDVSGSCYMQLVPENEHSAISHRGAIDEFLNDAM